MKRLVLGTAVLAVSLFGLVACGDDKVAAPPTYTVTATEGADHFMFDVPSDVKGGVVTFTLESAAGNKEGHDFQLARLPDGHTTAEVLAQVSSEEAPLEPWLKSGAGIGTIGPGQSATATFKLAPNAKYVFFCTESSDDAKIGSHAKHGMSGTFTTGDDSGAEMPQTDASIATKEYTFTFDGLKAGTNTITFENQGTMLHHVLIFPIVEGKTIDDVKKAFASDDQSGPPPVDFEKGVGTAVAGAGESIVFTAKLAAGKYAVVCFMPDPGTAGPPHFTKGMIKELVIS